MKPEEVWHSIDSDVPCPICANPVTYAEGPVMAAAPSRAGCPRCGWTTDGRRRVRVLRGTEVVVDGASCLIGANGFSDFQGPDGAVLIVPGDCTLSMKVTATEKDLPMVYRSLGDDGVSSTRPKVVGVWREGEIA